ncbi:hypothetical protein EDC04DRAFT_886234 [Pisolithus marmoratus]|nr:hypothetical protein EDC04DRAFT_886234 [Pisolithus marmoratus]
MIGYRLSRTSLVIIYCAGVAAPPLNLADPTKSLCLPLPGGTNLITPFMSYPVQSSPHPVSPYSRGFGSRASIDNRCREGEQNGCINLTWVSNAMCDIYSVTGPVVHLRI